MYKMMDYNRARAHLNEVSPEVFGWIVHNIKIWDENVHGMLSAHNMIHMIVKNHAELESVGASYWRSVEAVANHEILQASRPVESLAGALSGFDHYLVGGR